MTLIKRLSLVMCALVLCATALGVLLVHNRDLSEQREQIQQWAIDKTGRDMQIRGDLRARLFPRPGISMHDVWVADAIGFENESFAQVDVANVSLRVLPLFTRVFRVSGIALRGASLNLHRDVDGRLNWADLMTRTSLVKSRRANLQQEFEAGLPLAALLSLGKLQIENGSIHWQDDISVTSSRLSGIRLKTGHISMHRPVAISTSLDLSIDGTEVSTSVSGDGQLDFELLENRYVLKLDQFKSVSSTADRPMAQLSGSGSAELVADMGAQRLEVRALNGQLAGMDISGDLTMTGVLGEPVYRGHFGAEKIDVVNLLVDSGIRVPSGLGSDRLREVAIQGSFETVRNNIEFLDVTLASDGIEVTGEVQVANWRKTPVYSGTFKSNAFNLQPWLAPAGISVRHESLFTHASIEGQFRQSGRLMALNKLDVVVDDTRTTGNVEIAETEVGITSIHFALHTDQFNVDRYFDVARLKDVTNQTQYDWLQDFQRNRRHMPLQGQWQFDGLYFDKTLMENLRVPLMATAQQITLPEVVATVYSGSIHASLFANFLSGEQQLTSRINLNGFEIRPWLAAYYEDEVPLGGTGNVSVDFHSRGESYDSLLQSAGGALNVTLSNGDLLTLDLLSQLDAAVAKTGRLVEPPSSGNDGVEQVQLEGGTEFGNSHSQGVGGTYFNELRFSAVLENGTLQTENLSFESPLMRVIGDARLLVMDLDFESELNVTLGHELANLRPEYSQLPGLKFALRLDGDLARLSESGGAQWRRPWQTGVDTLIWENQHLLDTQANRSTIDIQDTGENRTLDPGSGESTGSQIETPNDSPARILEDAPIGAALPGAGGDEADFDTQLRRRKAKFDQQLDENIRRELLNLLRD